MFSRYRTAARTMSGAYLTSSLAVSLETTQLTPRTGQTRKESSDFRESEIYLAKKKANRQVEVVLVLTAIEIGLP